MFKLSLICASFFLSPLLASVSPFWALHEFSQTKPFFNPRVSEVLSYLDNTSEILLEIVDQTDDPERLSVLKTMLLVEIVKAEKIFHQELEYRKIYPGKEYELDIGDEWFLQFALTELQRARAIAES